MLSAFERDMNRLLPLLAWERVGGLWRTLHSSFPFLYGGPVPRFGPQGQDRLPAVLSATRSPWSSLRVTGNPFSPVPDTSTLPDESAG